MLLLLFNSTALFYIALIFPCTHKVPYHKLCIIRFNGFTLYKNRATEHANLEGSFVFAYASDTSSHNLKKSWTVENIDWRRLESIRHINKNDYFVNSSQKSMINH